MSHSLVHRPRAVRRLRRSLAIVAHAWRSLGQTRAGIVVGLVAALCSINAIANDFTLDDEGVIVKNAFVHHLAAIWQSFGRPYWPESTNAGQYRPLAIASFAIDWVVSGGSPHWMHLVNVAWHVAGLRARLAALAGFPLCRRCTGGCFVLCGAAGPRGSDRQHRRPLRRSWQRRSSSRECWRIGEDTGSPCRCTPPRLRRRRVGIVMLGLVVANDVLLGGVGRASAVTTPAGDAASGEIPLQGAALWRVRWPLYAGYFAVAAGLRGDPRRGLSPPAARRDGPDLVSCFAHRSLAD